MRTVRKPGWEDAKEEHLEIEGIVGTPEGEPIDSAKEKGRPRREVATVFRESQMHRHVLEAFAVPVHPRVRA